MNAPKKPRSDSPLRSLPEDVQAEVIGWLKEKSQAEVRRLVKSAHGFEPSDAALSGFWSWYHVRRQLARNESTAQALVAELAQENPDISPEKLQEAGQAFFSALAVEQQDAIAWAAAQKIGIARQQLALDREKFQRETCALFLKWAEDQRAQAIAQGSAPNAQKIEQLGQLMFGEDWKQ